MDKKQLLKKAARDYSEKGYVVLRQLFPAHELNILEDIVAKYHRHWIRDNNARYHEGAVNSAYLTNGKYISAQERMALFEFISSDAIVTLLEALVPDRPCFGNTQLFFDPFDKQQKNYWHRDIQYASDSEERQMHMLETFMLLHFRVPLRDEVGVELIPGTHRRWDSPDEANVRLEKNGRHVYDDIEGGKVIALARGDLLVFSASMIHRGLYGDDRMAFDICCGEVVPQFLSPGDRCCFPEVEEAAAMKNGFIFMHALDEIARQS